MLGIPITPFQNDGFSPLKKIMMFKSSSRWPRPLGSLLVNSFTMVKHPISLAIASLLAQVIPWFISTILLV